MGEKDGAEQYRNSRQDGATTAYREREGSRPLTGAGQFLMDMWTNDERFECTFFTFDENDRELGSIISEDHPIKASED